METKEKEKKPSKTSSHEQKQFVSKKKKRNYSIQHNFYDQKPCLTHINYNEKPAIPLFEEKQFSKQLSRPGQKDGRTKIEDTRQI